MQKQNSNHIPNKILILGVGNTLRSDDGVGAYICTQIDAMHLTDVTISIVQQLHVELIEELLNYNFVIITDASVTGKDVEFYSLESYETQAESSSHHLNAGMLSMLIEKMYRKKIPIFLCSVRGENFEVGEIFSLQAIKNANNAIKIICDCIKTKSDKQ